MGIIKFENFIENRFIQNCKLAGKIQKIHYNKAKL